MSDTRTYNVLDGELDVEREDQHPGYAVGGTLAGERIGTESLGVTLYVLPAGNANAPYHWHHNVEELLLVLDGTPTLRTPDGARQLRPGDLVSFPRGADGAHKVGNESDSVARYLVFSTKPEIDIVEYPDSGKVGFGSKGRGSRMLRPGDELDYWDGE
ncbi:MAG TPA: cupin domain-containing protein [Gaiellaceae bacterium]|nr:cupin domain-containing protein [Gaiellaceae bacterium]